MIEIKPAVIPKKFEDVQEAADFAVGKAKILHVDMCDGVFVKSVSWQLPELPDGLPRWQDIDYEVDLMVADPLKVMKEWIEAGAISFVAHVEGLDDAVFNSLREAATEAEVQLILAFNIITPIDKYAQWIDSADGVQCMGIGKIGYQGQPFDTRAYGQIKKARELFPQKLIQADGGVSLETEEGLIAAGADILVAGSAAKDLL